MGKLNNSKKEKDPKLYSKVLKATGLKNIGKSGTPSPEQINRILNKLSPAAFLLAWDFKEQPDWKQINKAIQRLQKAGKQIKIVKVNTGNDSEAIVISDPTLTQAQADSIYQSNP